MCPKLQPPRVGLVDTAPAESVTLPGQRLSEPSGKSAEWPAGLRVVREPFGQLSPERAQVGHAIGQALEPSVGETVNVYPERHTPIRTRRRPCLSRPKN